MPLCQIGLIFCSVSNQIKLMACFGLMQNEVIWNFHGSLTLIKGELILYSGSL